MHIVIMGVHVKQCAISLSKLADWGPACSQPGSLIRDIPMKYARAPIFQTVGFRTVAQLVEGPNGRDHDYCPWFTMRCGSMG